MIKKACGHFVFGPDNLPSAHSEHLTVRPVRLIARQVGNLVVSALPSRLATYGDLVDIEVARNEGDGSAKPLTATGGAVGEPLEDGVELGDHWTGVDAAGLARAARAQAERALPGAEDMVSYLAAQVSDDSHRDVVGPLLDGQGASGVVVRRGVVVASWGDPAREEMAFSATKSVLSLVAGVAFDDGRLRLDEPVCRSVDLPQFANGHGRGITWRHLLDQTSQWEGELWGSPRRSTPRAHGRGRSRQEVLPERAGPTTTSG